MLNISNILRKTVLHIINLSFFEHTKLLYAKLRDYFREIFYKINHLRATNIKLAYYHFNRGNWRDTIFRLKLLQLFRVFKAEFPLLLAFSYLCLGNNKKSREYFAIYCHKPQISRKLEMDYLEAVLNQSQQNLVLNSESVELPFVAIPDEFSKALVNSNMSNKKAGFWIKKHKLAIAEHFTAAINDFSRQTGVASYKCLELGARNGEIGRVVGQIAEISSIEAVEDISTMLEDSSPPLKNADLASESLPKKTARAHVNNLDKEDSNLVDQGELKGEAATQDTAIQSIIYAKIHCQSVAEFLGKAEAQKTENFDVVLVHEALSHNSNLALMFKRVTTLTNDKALLLMAFDTKQVNKHNLVYFDKFFQKFYYNKDYITEIAKQSGWTNKRQEHRIKLPESTEKIIVLAFDKQPQQEQK